MIKLFHKKRKQLLGQNKRGRYSKFTSGEIVLAMISNLLTLRLNNWNTNHELKKEKLKVMKRLHQEFSENLSRFISVCRIHLKRRKSIETLMARWLSELSLDSISFLNRVASDNYTYDSFQGIYDSIINSGKIELISNDALKLKI